MTIHRIKPFIFLAILTLASCSSKEDVIETTFEFEKIPLKSKMQKALGNDYLEQLNFSTKEIEFVQELYSTNKLTSFWINDSMLSTEGEELQKHLENKFAFGIPTTRNYCDLSSKDNFIQKELKLTVSLSRMIADLSNGFLVKDSAAYKGLQLATLEKFSDFLTQKNSKNQIDAFWNCGPADTAYQLFAKYLFSAYSKGNIDHNSFSIKAIKGDSLKTAEASAVALKSKGYLNTVNPDSTELADALIHFQNDNQLTPDGLIGKNTAIALNESSWDKLNRLALAMERIRQQQTYPDKYLLINLPEYTLKFYINDTLTSEHEIVIGKLGNETPQLKASVKKIIVYPYWKVPYSISSKEILPAAQSNPNYFAKHNYKIYRKDEEVDPLTVNWKAIKENSFPYVVMQDPGPKNSLGIIKFDMPNNQSIYIHDTPSKGLFSTKTRAYSHGCMRCNHPLDLAKAILLRDELNNKFNPIIADSLDSIVARNANYEIKLMNYIPVIMEYRTVVVQKNEVKLFIDIYGREAEYIELFNGKKKGSKALVV